MTRPAFFVTTIPLEKAKKLEDDLIAQGFILTRPVNTVFQAQKTGITCTLYKSGKLSVQGKDKEDFIVFYLEPEILGSLAYSNPEIYLDKRPRIGIDEAGKGDFFGPLCIAGVKADEEEIQKLLLLGVKDSKKMSDSAISAMAKKIKETTPYTIVKISPERYNELYQSFGNLNSLLAWGHATAITDLFEKTGCPLAVIDQFAHQSVVERALAKKKIAITLEQRHRAEEDPVVAAASILARNAFVEAIDALGKRYGMPIPKGASNGVIEAGIKLVSRFGKEVLSAVAKTHFTTMEVILRAQTTDH